jgi:hypothetical protein
MVRFKRQHSVCRVDIPAFFAPNLQKIDWRPKDPIDPSLTTAGWIEKIWVSLFDLLFDL